VRPAAGDLSIEAARPLPELTQRLQDIQNAYATDGTRRHVDAVEFLFRGTWNKKAASGYLFAATTRIVQRGGNAIWFAGDLGSLQGFIAAEDRIPTAVAVMDRMRTSFEINPQWYRDNTRAIEATLRMAGDANRHASAAISRSFANTQPPYTSIYERFAYYKHDVVPFRYPQTERIYPAQAGPNYYWIADRGLIVGTTTSFNPDPLWFRDVLAVKP
jgi:hypothetical protein